MEPTVQKLTELARRLVQDCIAPVVNRATGGKLHPDAVTVGSFLMHIPIAWLIATQHNYWAALFLVIFGAMDALDGALARLQKRESARGMLLDSATDRMKEVLLYSGAAYAIIASTGRPYLAVWAVAACGCSLLTSYMNAIGDAAMARFSVKKHAINKAFRGGLFPFQVRMLVLFVGLLSNRVPLAIIVIAIGAAYTALSRLFLIIGQLKHVQG